MNVMPVEIFEFQSKRGASIAPIDKRGLLIMVDLTVLILSTANKSLFTNPSIEEIYVSVMIFGYRPIPIIGTNKQAII